MKATRALRAALGVLGGGDDPPSRSAVNAIWVRAMLVDASAWTLLAQRAEEMENSDLRDRVKRTVVFALTEATQGADNAWMRPDAAFIHQPDGLQRSLGDWIRADLSKVREVLDGVLSL